MKVFLSWSGERSQQVAQLLSDWLPRVIQCLKPWISTRDIEKGSRWSDVIADELQEMTTGIICLTMENKEKPWILFEAGALAKGLTNNRVCTFLIDLEPSDIAPPLSQFNHTNSSTKEDVLVLLQTLNDRLNERKLRSNILENALDAHWEYFIEKLEEIKGIEDKNIEYKPRDNNEILREILENTRNIPMRVLNIERRIAKIMNKEENIYDSGSRQLSNINSFIENATGKKYTSEENKEFISKLMKELGVSQ